MAPWDAAALTPTTFMEFRLHNEPILAMRHSET
jgi:hypothetical protein